MFQDKQMRAVIRISLVVFIILIAFFIYNIIQKKNLESQVEKKPVLSLTTDSNIFKVDSVEMYSSANALNNSDVQGDYWDLNLYQFTDLAVYIDNHVSISDSTQKNTVKELYIDNITYPSLPKKGNPKLYYKDSKDLGIGIINEDKLISDRLDFKVVSSNNSNSEEPQFYADCSNPMLFSAINHEVVKSFPIRNTNSAVIFDGNLLLDATILLSTIEYEVSFTIHIINYLDEEYTCTVTIPIVLGDENDVNTIYDGSYQLTINDLSTNKFYKKMEE